tara:strand:+ start:308 stop:880 length:573 start_codon:yes stop_codon:yes gene_type:complete
MKKILFVLFCFSLVFTNCKKEADIPIKNLSIGDIYQGGIIFYLDATSQQGLVCDFQDLGNAEWGCHDTLIAGADGINIGEGFKNTIDIEAGCSKANTAADYCVNNYSGGYADWFLPSKEELNQMYLNKSYIDSIALSNGGSAFTTNYYWSSSQTKSKHEFDTSWGQYFGNGFQYGYDKSSNCGVRAIRSF